MRYFSCVAISWLCLSSSYLPRNLRCCLLWLKPCLLFSLCLDVSRWSQFTLFDQVAVVARSSLSTVTAPCSCADADRADPPSRTSLDPLGPASAGTAWRRTEAALRKKVKALKSHMCPWSTKLDLYITNNLSIDVRFGQYLESEGAKKSKYWENHL